jgi:tetratricopeptide (TPR) repeat protein
MPQTNSQRQFPANKQPKRLLLVLFLATTLLGQVQQVNAQLNTDRVMAIGRSALYFEDYVLSIQYFNQVIDAKPFLAEPYFFRAVAKLYLEDFKGADEDCTLALERNNFMVRAFLCRSYARMSLEDFDGAIEDCIKGLEFEQDNKSLMQNMAVSQLEAKRFDDARKSLADLEKRYPNYVYTHMMYGQLHVEEGDTLAAVEDYSRAIAIDPHFAPARAGRAYAYLLKDDYANALPDLDEAIRLNPDAPGYYINRGLARYHLNNLRGTLDDFDSVIRLDPNNALAWYNRGLIRSQVGDLNRAIEDFDKVIQLDPHHHVAIYNRALVRTQVGEYKAAINDLDLIINEYPEFTPALYQRSEVKRKAGDAKGADKDYFAAWNLDEKLKSEREDRRRNPDKYAAADSLRNANREAKREAARDIASFNQTILAEDDNTTMSQYQNPMRGRVQDRQVELDIEDLYTLTFYEQTRPGPTRRLMDYSRYLTPFQQAGIKDFQRLLITNLEQSLDNKQAAEHFKSIEQLSSKIGQDPSNPRYFLARAIEFALVQDINSALDDLDRSLTLDPSQTLAYFARANLRYRRMNVELAEREEDMVNERSAADNRMTTISSLSSSNRNNALNDNDIRSTNSRTANRGVLSGSTSTVMPRSTMSGNDRNLNLIGESTFGMDYELVMRDYERVLELDPTFIYAWYNRGNIRCLQRDFRNALVDYTKALEINPDFADAWFNRGLTHIRLGNRAQGIADLRMAGQLGLYKSYNLIKRFE